MLSKLNPWAALVLVAFILGFWGCVAVGRIPVPEAGVGTVMAAVLALLPKLFAGPGGAS